MTRKTKKIILNWFWRMMILLIAMLLITIAGNQQSIMVNQEEIKTMQTDTLDQLMEIQTEQETSWFDEDIDLDFYDDIVTPPDEIEPVSLGTFTVTHYCDCTICCGKTDGICKNGEKAIPDYTIATDPKVIPTGSVVMIDGKEYKAMDTGGAIKGNKIDIFVSSHQEAVNRGKFVREVTYAEN